MNLPDRNVWLAFTLSGHTQEGLDALVIDAG
jgi:hypothetical protein